VFPLVASAGVLMYIRPWLKKYAVENKAS
jgi:hypothetical protein